MYSLLVSLDSFELPLIVGLPGRVYVFTTLIYFSAQGLFPPNYGLASAFGMTFLIFGLILVGLNRLVVKDPERYSIVTGKGYRPRLVHLGKWRFVAFAGVSLYVFLTVIAPLAVLLWVSLSAVLSGSLAQSAAAGIAEELSAVLNQDLVIDAVVNTIIVGVATATLVLLLAFAISWVVVRLKLPGKATTRWRRIPASGRSVDHYRAGDDHPLRASAVERIADIRHGLDHRSGIDHALSGLRHPRHERRVVQVSKELEEAARASGAGRIRMLFRITLPLILPAFVSAWIWVVAHAMRAFSIPLILASSDTELISVRLWVMWERGDAPRRRPWGSCSSPHWES